MQTESDGIKIADHNDDIIDSFFAMQENLLLMRQWIKELRQMIKRDQKITGSATWTGPFTVTLENKEKTGD